MVVVKEKATSFTEDMTTCVRVAPMKMLYKTLNRHLMMILTCTKLMRASLPVYKNHVLLVCKIIMIHAHNANQIINLHLVHVSISHSDQQELLNTRKVLWLYGLKLLFKRMKI